MKRLTLAELVERFHEPGRWRYPRHVPQEQRARLQQLLPALERLHSKLDIHSSAAFVELAYSWAGNEVQRTVEDAQKGLEFLAQQAEEAAQRSGRDLGGVGGFLDLREPWKAAGSRTLSPNGAGKDFPSYGEFMLAAVSALQALPAEQRGRYLSMVKFTVETELGTGSKFTEGSLMAIQEYGIDAVERYAKAGFEWLSKWRSSQKDPYHATDAGREVLRSVWYFMMEYKGTEEGAQRLREYLVRFREVADCMEHNLFFLTAQRKLTDVVLVPANKMAIWQVFREISELANRGERIGYRLWEVVNSAANSAKVEKEEDAVKFAQALKDNYVATLAKALESSNGKAEGLAADLLDRRNAETIARHLDNKAFWESLASVVSETQTISPGSWVPSTEDAALPFLESVKGPYFNAEKELLIANAPDIAQRIGLGPRLAVLDLGIGNGEKLAAFLKAMLEKANTGRGHVAICGVDSNSIIALEGLEGVIKGAGVKWSSITPKYEDKTFVVDGRIEWQLSETKVNLNVLIEHFENLYRLPSYQRFVQEHPDYLTTFLGTTFSNFEPEKAGALLNTLVGQHALIGLHLYNSEDAELLAMYDTPQNLAMAQHYLLLQGVSSEDFDKFEHVVEVRKRREKVGTADLGIVTRLMTYLVVKSDQQAKGALRQFNQGDAVNVGLSVKYTDEQARTVLKQFGFEVAQDYRKGDSGLYLVERIAVPHNSGK